MRVEAAVVNEPRGQFGIELVDLDEPVPDEVIVRVEASGICHTDLHARDGYFPIPFPAVLGHEGVGIVERVGSSVQRLRVGDRVVMVAPFCGACTNCMRSFTAYCSGLPALKMNGLRADGSATLRRNGQRLGGSFFQQSSFATHAIATERNVVKIDCDVERQILAALPCGLSTGASAAINVLGVSLGASFAVLGAGAVGLAGLMAARDRGASPLIAVDIRPNRLALAGELGATHTLDGRDPELAREMREITSGTGVNRMMDTTASPELITRAAQGLAVLGMFCLLGTPRDESEFRIDMRNILYGRMIRGSIQGDSHPQAFVPYLVHLYRTGRFPIDRLITRYELDTINEAARDLESGHTIKPVIDMWDRA